MTRLKMHRRQFIHSAFLASAYSQCSTSLLSAAFLPSDDSPFIDLPGIIDQPVIIESLAVRKYQNQYFIHVQSKDGVSGIVFCNDNQLLFFKLMEERIFPHFMGKDARNIPQLLQDVYRPNYKLTGLPFWNSIGHVELALWDMLGKTAGIPVFRLLGEPFRSEVDIYLSSMRRDTTPEQETELLMHRLEETGARAVKIKIGGRMSHNIDASPGRTERLIALSRKVFGNEITLYADANGSYTSDYAIEIGNMLENYGFGFFEEPCPWEEFTETKKVADRLQISVAGGEQDSSIPHFKYMIENKVLDIIQPDLLYNGGLYRTLLIARLADRHNMLITPHCPKNDHRSAFMLHFAAAVKNIGPFMEFLMDKPFSSFYSPVLEVKQGKVTVPDGPGFGICFDDDILLKSETIYGK